MNNIYIFDRNIFTFIYFQSPFVVLMVFFTIGLISLFVCPKEIRTIELKTEEGIADVGFLSSYNWSIIYPFIVPISLFIIISLYQSIPIAINNLINAKVITTAPNIENIYIIINNKICGTDFYWILFIFIISLVLNFFDYASYYFDKDKDDDVTKVKDWTVAFQKWNDINISKRKNLLFNLLMYSQQWFISFVTFVFVYKSYKIIHFFYVVFHGKNPSIIFKIDYLDVYHQYGFWGVNPIVTYMLLIIVLILSFFTIIRFVHVTRNVSWNFFPRYLSYIFILLVIGGIFSFYSVIDKNLELGRNLTIMELLIKKDKLNDKINSDDIFEIEFLKLNELIKSVDSDISTVLSQNILQYDYKLYYLFIAIYIIQLRLIIFPPKSWTDALKNILKEET